MKKLMSLLLTMTFLSVATAQDVRVERINNIEPNTEYDSYAFLDGDQQMNQRSQNNISTYEGQTNENQRSGDQMDTGQQGELQSGQAGEYRQNDTRVGSAENRDQANRENQTRATDQDVRNGQNSSVQNWATLNPIENVILKEAITYQFDVEGLEMKTDDPDIFVQYHIYSQEYSEDEAYAGSAGAGINSAGADDEYESAYRKKQDMMDRIEDGTVVLTVVDAEEGRSVWEGFAYNSFKEDASVREKQIGLRQAVDALVTQFLADNEDMTGPAGITR